MNTPYNYGYVRVASAVPACNVADVEANVGSIIDLIVQAEKRCVSLVAFPEMCITGYTCADLFANELLLSKAKDALLAINRFLADKNIMVVVGAPLRANGHLFNCAVVIQGGGMWAVPKTYIPNYKEFYEKRWFATGNILHGIAAKARVGERDIPLGTNMIFDAGHVKIAVEICEDLWAPVPPSTIAAVNGANMIVNISASNEVIGKHSFLQNLIRHQSNQSIAAYVYSSAGYGESSTDLVFAGNAIIAENGRLLCEGKRFNVEPQLIVADVDVQQLDNERQVNGSFSDSLIQYSRHYECVPVDLARLDYDSEPLLRTVRSHPFIPGNDEQLNARCEEIINIQSEGLMRRLDATGIKSGVIGISGGLDSTLALMVAVRAFDRLGMDRKGLHAITMPGMGTTDRTHDNAVELMQALGVSVHEINIAAAVSQHFKDIGHDPQNHDTTYENSQARERTQLLMDYANKIDGLVLGTGDLSELALGWATYNGDHMSMYNVNCGIPKTLVRCLINWMARQTDDQTVSRILLDVLNTPISPELTPADQQGNIQQITEDIIGPYELHDFFLYNMVRFGYSPRKIFLLAKKAFDGEYDSATIKKWLTTFTKRFFGQQFKRSCLPDGPKVGSVSLSPRGDWRMPSDACRRLWQEEGEKL